MFNFQVFFLYCIIVLLLLNTQNDDDDRISASNNNNDSNIHRFQSGDKVIISEAATVRDYKRTTSKPVARRRH